MATEAVPAVALPSGLVETVVAIDTDPLAELLDHSDGDVLGVRVKPPVFVRVRLVEPLRLDTEDCDTVLEED